LFVSYLNNPFMLLELHEFKLLLKVFMHSLQNVLIGMDIPIYENKKVANEYSIFNIGSEDDLPFDEDYFEVSNHFSSFLC